MRRLAPVSFLLVTALATPVAAQSAQVFSVQASGLLMSLLGSAFSDKHVGTGLGAEFQFRINPGGQGSFGAGFQWTKHNANDPDFDDKLTLTGFFVEPRLTIRVNSRKVRPYVAGRVAYLHQSIRADFGAGGFRDASAGGLAIGAGGGFIARLGPTVNFDLGSAFTSASFGNYKLSGVDTGQDAGNGASFVLKAGINIGIGH